jgi:preprotein translocase subunit SecE
VREEMVDDNKKIITVSFVFAAAVLAFTVHLLIELLAANFAFMAQVSSSAGYANGIPVGIGILVFSVLQFNSHTVAFMDSVVGELKKVVWPSRRDTMLMTVVVSITLIIAGVLVGALDSVWAYLINYLLK